MLPQAKTWCCDAEERNCVSPMEYKKRSGAVLPQAIGDVGKQQQLFFCGA